MFDGSSKPHGVEEIKPASDSPQRNGRVPMVSIITVNYNQYQLTTELLDSLRAIDFDDYEIIVVDNGSIENPKTQLESDYPEVIFVRSEGNLGFAGGNNLGIQRSTGKYLFLINNDAELTKGALESLLDTFRREAHVGAVSPLICFDNVQHIDEKADIIQFAGTTRINPLTGRNKTIGRLEADHGQFDHLISIPYAHGAAMMVSRELVQRVGMMSEVFFLYYEELDWCERIRRAGYKIFLQPKAKVFHKESASIGNMSKLKIYYLNRNRILFMRRNYSGWQLSVFFLFFLLFAVPKHVAQFAVRYDWRRLGAFLRAVRDGLRVSPHG